MLGLGPVTMAILVVVALAVTLAADWLVALRRGEPFLPAHSILGHVDDWLGRLLWVGLMTVGGAIATRYVERIDSPALGFGLFGLVALLLSLARAAFYRASGQRDRVAGRLPGVRDLLHSLVYLLAALVLFTVLCWLLRARPAWGALLVLAVGALLPDLDSPGSLLGRLLPFVSRPLAGRVGHRQQWHTPLVAAALGLAGLPLIALGGWQAWLALPVGFMAHLAVDLLSPEGVMLLWPLSRSRQHLRSGPQPVAGGRGERWLALLLALVAGLLLLVVGVGPEPPPPIVAPSFEQTLERYYNQRGRNLVFASVEGAWQTTGRRTSGRFEVLNARGTSFVLLDRYTGQVFTAGRGATDDFYLTSVNLQTGDAVRVKPAEIRLADEPLANILPVLYQMQAEPGIQHLYVSGDLILAGEPLAVDLAQTSLRRVREPEAGHYTLDYLPAARLVALAHLQVERGELVAVATYLVEPAGPTATPLPSPEAP